MGDTWDHERFREYVLTSAANAGIVVETTADLSRATGIPRAPISKWFRGIEQPGVKNLRKLAAGIKAPLVELLVLAGRSSSDELGSDEPRPVAVLLVDPLAQEVAQMLDTASPIPAEDKAHFRAMLELLVASQRKWMPKRRQKAPTG